MTVTMAQLFAILVGILVLIVLLAGILRLRRRGAAARHGEHIRVDVARPETIAETGLDEGASPRL
jgi:hypothetical protein